ncbi:NHLP family bacteriocin export ABC transporter peptidase/permease/ATPase subunit [Candidatus Contubernalis alkaliaceticus]|uniref:NHLP family bacteriocin export ABC transporter peptidase/permease/ATPase subunit n=1 Tax=Candidatus Contubernalis alkaliaceticus TaxID=338645 RepID=UPI001F4C0B51|nr:NHLP family bacteriocin export ABC transporter peptidase/permease/ATPase subunit [Candidatus Contubernalis alkalaceticus]UNC93199.1 NHLP family bacteriocin export ABC transporter peptidase/permease/ATPase subunit [Candidatus Contubernalis alkalaceticus]
MINPHHLKNHYTRKFSSKRVKTPTLLQMEAVECGAAALGIILRYYEKYIPLEELRVACGVSRDGSKALNIVKAARNYGLEAKGYRKELAELKEMDMPVILHWNFSHFLVLEGIDRGRVYLNDPAKGPCIVSEEELDHSFTGIVLSFKPTPLFQKSQYRPSLYGSLKSRLSGLKVGLVLIVILGLYLVIPGILMPAFTRIFVDDILLAGRQEWLVPLFFGMGLTILAQLALSWFRQYYLLQLENRLAISSSGKYLWHVLRLPVEFYYQRLMGELGSRVQGNDRVAALLTGQLASAFLDLLVIGFFMLIMLQYDILLTGLALFFALVNLVFLGQMSRKRKDNSSRLMQERGKMIGYSMVGLQMIDTLKATGQEADFFARWAGYQANVVKSEQELGQSALILMSVPQLLMSLAAAFILVAGGYRVMEGMLTIGMLVAFQGLMMNFMEPVTRLVNLGTRLQEVEADMARLDDVMNHPLDSQLETPEDGMEQIEGSPAKLSGQVEIRNVTFGYNPQAPPLIEDFHLSLTPGSRVALVGASGSGKSTVARLVAGLFKPWKGEILFDGQKRTQIPRPVINSSVAVVDQNISMLEGSIRDNITLWDHDLPEIHVIQAAKDAGIDEVISRKKDGYEGTLKEGGRNFSGGERQRLDIARALSNNPTILILDEATSALDPLTEKIIDENIRRRGCTCIMVAHRLSTIRDCDEIIVMEQGKVVQRGTHDQLITQEGLYMKLISSQ